VAVKETGELETELEDSLEDSSRGSCEETVEVDGEVEFITSISSNGSLMVASAISDLLLGILRDLDMPDGFEKELLGVCFLSFCGVSWNIVFWLLRF